MKFKLLRAKSLTEKTDYATLQHVHKLFFSPTETQNTKIKSSLQYHLFFTCSTAPSAWQHAVQENPCQKDLTFVYIGLTITFLPSTLSPSFSGEALMWKGSKFCTDGIIMAACSFSLFDQNTMALCVLAGHMRFTQLLWSLMWMKCSLSPCCWHAYVQWTMWTGLCCVFKSHNKNLPQLCHPQWNKVAMIDTASWSHEIHMTKKIPWWSNLKGTFAL